METNKRFNGHIIPEILENGWYHSGEIQWITEQFPEEVKDVLLIDDNNEDNDEYGTDEDSDEDSDNED